jgi:fluoroquinolone transport system permease protein
MRAADVLRALGPIDLASVRRDPLLRWMGVIPVALALGFRWGVPWVESEGLELERYRPLLASIVLLTTPMIYGAVIGFLLLDERDDGTLTALRVTPLTVTGYLAYRIAVPCLLSIAMSVVALQLSGQSRPGLLRQALAAVAVAPLAPAFALFLAAYARNKVQGFALMKAAGVVNWPPLIAWFVDPPAQWLFGLCPTYWPAKLAWELEQGAGVSALWLFPICVLVLSGLVALLLRRFDRVLRRD